MSIHHSIAKAKTKEKQHSTSLLICQIDLPNNYNQEVWQQIVEAYSPSKFQKQNEKIFNYLMNDEKMFNMYFTRFYKNHSTLKNWYTLASSKHWQLERYQCKWIFQKSLKEYKEQMRKMSLEDKMNDRKSHYIKSLSKQKNSLSIHKNSNIEQNKTNNNFRQENMIKQGSSNRKTVKIFEYQKSEKKHKLGSQEAVKGLANQIFNFFSNNSHSSNQKRRNFNMTKSIKMGSRKCSKIFNIQKAIKTDKQQSQKQTIKSDKKCKTFEDEYLSGQKQKFSKTIGGFKKQIHEQIDDKISSQTKIKGEEGTTLRKEIKEKTNVSHKKIEQKILHQRKINYHIEEKKKQNNSLDQLKQNPQNINLSLKNSYDFHDLYLQTFHACDGLRYIFYNFEKHMKGLSERQKYNTFIRQNKRLNSKNFLNYSSSLLNTGNINNFQGEEKYCQCSNILLQKKEQSQIVAKKKMNNEQESRQQMKQKDLKQNNNKKFLGKQKRKVLKASIASISSLNSQMSPYQQILLKNHNFMVKIEDQKCQKRMPMIQVKSENRHLLKEKTELKNLKIMRGTRNVQKPNRISQTLVSKCPKCCYQKQLFFDSSVNLDKFRDDSNEQNEKRSDKIQLFRNNCYQFLPIGCRKQFGMKKNSEIIFRRINTKNAGKFIRK